MAKRTLTYSSLRKFRNCRKQYFNRIVKELVPLQTDANLWIGSVFHECLERWGRLDMEGLSRDADAAREILAHIDQCYPNRAGDPEQNRQWHLNRAMFLGYIRRYRDEPFRVMAVEKTFDCPIVNPTTGYPSRSFRMAGKVDALVQMKETGEFFIVEHKSAAQISGDYIERLPLDFQVLLYAHHLSKDMDIPIAGVIYDVVGKAQLKQKQGETEEEFEARKAELLAKSKTGKTSAKRRVGETDEEYQERLAEKYRDPAMFHREILYVSQADIGEVVVEVWELTQQLLRAYNDDRWYRNDSMCFHYGRPCPYFPLCRSGGNPNLRENLYERKPAHSELVTDGDESPAF